MKLIIKKNADVQKLNRLGEFVTIEINDYVLQPDEELLKNVSYIEETQILGIIDYRQKRDCYKYLAQTFNEQPSDIKEKICEWCATTPDVVIPYYMGQGMSYEESIIKYKNNRAIDIRNACDSYKVVINGQELAMVMVKYLPQNELQRFVDETFKLTYLYGNYGVWGKKYDDYVDGILDFIEDYGIYAGKGLSTYTLNPGMILQDFIDEMKAIIII